MRNPISSINSLEETNDKTRREAYQHPDNPSSSDGSRGLIQPDQLGERGSSRPTRHMVSAVRPGPLSIWRAWSVPARSPYGERGSSRLACHMASMVHPGPLAIWRAWFVPARPFHPGPLAKWRMRSVPASPSYQCHAFSSHHRISLHQTMTSLSLVSSRLELQFKFTIKTAKTFFLV